MSQSIDVGSVLGGRYQVTESVKTSAEGDLVLQGIDQVLNRSVSILVAATENSSQLASSAREIAMAERLANVQVLDLGITDSNQTYLVANVTQTADLLNLVVESDAPYVEPFFTDTLGTEIFGQSRESVPETYEDDEQYYEDLQYDNHPEEQGRIGNALTSGFSGIKNRFGRGRNQASPEDTAPEPVELESADEDNDPQTAPTEVAAPSTTPVSPVAQPSPKPGSSDKPKVTRLDDEPSVTATAALSAAELSKGNAPKKQDIGSSIEDNTAAAAAVPTPAKPTAPAAPTQEKPKTAAKPAADAATPAGAAKASTFPAAAKGVSRAGTEPLEEKNEDSNGKGVRLLVGAVLIAVLVIGVVFAFNFLGRGGDEPVAQSPTEQGSDSTGGADSAEESPSEEQALPSPVIADVSRLVPGNQQLNSETDATLSNMIDGNPASSYTTFSYTTSNFGGFASNMVFILELEAESAISEISLEGMNASGGDYEILVGESNDLGEAESVAKGSFTGPTVSVPVSADEDQVSAQYVFLNVTDLPRRASGANPSRPFGLQIGEFSAK